MKKVIVTGATGMIGASMIQQMLADGIQVTAVCRPNSKKRKNLMNHNLLDIFECDINDLSKLSEQLPHDYDTFYHFAWDGTYGASRDDVMLQEANVKNTLIAVETAHDLGCSVFVGAGSQAEFGYVNGELSDDIPKNPITGYGIAKLTAGKLSALLCEQYGIRQSWGRIVSTYGPGDNSYTMVMSSIIGMLKGERLSFTKGDQIWDYVYGGDCSKAFYLIGKSGKHGKAYTIGSGKSRPLRDYIMDIRDVINPKLEIGIGEREYYPNQVMHLTADIHELTEDTGFVPSVDFKEGIRKTIEWYEGVN
ncbi:NAD(P)-dependent oxidoreductase [Clostridium sp. AM42-36]|jgi:UDP-glucose 4-epimerase|nr:NAD(P)-dependent oxidoreductase [Clostridium sp. AM42-36]